MLSEVLWFLISICHVFSDSQTPLKYAYQKNHHWWTILTSFCVQDKGVHYYFNAICLIFHGHLIEIIIDDLGLVIILSLSIHVLSTLISFYYYQLRVYGASFVIYMWVGLVLSSRYHYMTILIVSLGVFALDVYFSKTHYFSQSGKIAHVGHL